MVEARGVVFESSAIFVKSGIHNNLKRERERERSKYLYIHYAYVHVSVPIPINIVARVPVNPKKLSPLPNIISVTKLTVTRMKRQNFGLKGTSRNKETKTLNRKNDRCDIMLVTMCRAPWVPPRVSFKYASF